MLKGRGSDWTYYSIPSGDGSYPHLFYTRTNSGATLLRAKIGGGAVVGSTEFTNNNFSINSNQLYVKQSDGNVGIGTTAPSAPLHVNSITTGEVLKLESTSAPYIRFVRGGVDKGFLQFTNTHSYLANQANGNFYFRTNNTDKMVITSTGNVGIGTTSPGFPLEISDIGNINTRLTSTGTSDSNGPILAFYKPNAGVANSNFQIEMRENDKLSFATNNDAFSSRQIKMVIQQDGNVGIGTTTPTEKLHVVGDVFIDGGLKVNAANIDFTGLGTTDPSVAGRLWDDRGTLKISSGE